MSHTPKAVRWIVQAPPAGDESPTHGQVARACQALSIAFQSIEVRPGEAVQLPPLEGPTVVHGRNTLLRAAIGDLRYRQSVFLDREKFTPEASLRAWGGRMLNASQRLTSWQELLESATSKSRFVRPNDDDKLFTGRVFDRDELRRLYDALFARGLVDPSDQVVTARPLEIDAEARVFIVDGKVVGGSFYRPSVGDPLPSEVVEFAEEAASRWTPAPVFVLDIARAQRRYFLIETNCFNASRFYASDVAAIVRRVSEYQASHWTTLPR